VNLADELPKCVICFESKIRKDNMGIEYEVVQVGCTKCQAVFCMEPCWTTFKTSNHKFRKLNGRIIEQEEKHEYEG